MCFGHKYLICETTFKNSFSDLFYLKETYFCKKKKSSYENIYKNLIKNSIIGGI